MKIDPHILYALTAFIWVVTISVLFFMRAMAQHARRRGLQLLTNIMPVVAVSAIAMALVLTYALYALARVLGAA